MVILYKIYHMINIVYLIESTGNFLVVSQIKILHILHVTAKMVSSIFFLNSKWVHLTNGQEEAAKLS